MWSHRDTLSARLVQRSKRAIDGGTRRQIETDAYFADGYYRSAKMLVRALNDGVKGRSETFSYDPVTQKVCVHMKGDTTFMLYGDRPDILGFGTGDGVVIRTTLTDRNTLTQGNSIVDLRRGFESL